MFFIGKVIEKQLYLAIFIGKSIRRKNIIMSTRFCENDGFNIFLFTFQKIKSNKRYVHLSSILCNNVIH